MYVEATWISMIQACWRTQLRITNAAVGKVDFELDITKDHTVRPPRVKLSWTYTQVLFQQNRLKILHGGTIASMVDLGGSLAVASTGLYATGVSTDLNGKYWSTPESGSFGSELKFIYFSFVP